MSSWEGYVPTQVDLPCGGETHWIRWEEGELTALNHPDATGERTLAALAGERVACIDFLELWACHRDDLRVLALASRGPGDPVTLQPPDRTQPGPGRPAGWAAYGAGGMVARSALVVRPPTAVGATPMPARLRPGPPMGHPAFDDPLIRLITTGGPLTDRLIATVAAVWADRVRAGDAMIQPHRAALHAAVYGRAIAAVRWWLGAPRLAVDVRMIDEDQPASIRRLPDGLVEVELPFSWIADVWARGLAVLLGRFVLRVAHWSPTRLVLDAAGSDLSGGGISALTISL